jgi:hypothetical protein
MVDRFAGGDARTTAIQNLLIINVRQLIVARVCRVRADCSAVSGSTQVCEE